MKIRPPARARVSLSLFPLLIALAIAFLGSLSMTAIPLHAKAPDPQGAPALPVHAWGEPRVVALPNGLTVLALRDSRFPLVSTRLYVRTGAAAEKPEEAGVSHLFEHMVFKGSAKRAPGAAAKDVEGAGGYLNAATSFDYTVYYVDLPAAGWKLGLDVLQDMVLGATVPAPELENERKVVLAELERGEDNPGQRLFKLTQKAIWAGTAYERPIIGFRETVESMTRETVLDYVARHYAPGAMLLAVVGDVDEEAAIREAGRLFGEFPAALRERRAHDSLTTSAITDLPARFDPAPSKAPVVQVQAGAWNKVYLSVAFPAPGGRAAQSAGLEVLGHLLGGDKTSRLYRRLVYERKLADDVAVSHMGLDRAGLIYLTANLDAASLPAFWTALMDELAGLSGESFTDEELARAKLNLEDGLYQSRETLSGLASKLGYFQFFEGDWRAEENFLYQLANVDRAELGSLIDRFLRPEDMRATLLVPASSPQGPQGPQGAAPSGTPTSEELAALVRPERFKRSAPKSAGAAGAGDAQGASVGPGGQEIVDLGAGRSLILIPDPTLPYLAVSAVWPGGDALLAPSEQGLAEMTARAMGLGAGKLSATEFQDFLAARAARVSAASGKESFSLSAKFPERFTGDVLGLLRDMIHSPSFAPDEVARAAREQVASIRSREDQPLGLAFRRLFPFLFEGSYGYLHLGEPGEVETFTPAQVADFWARQRAKPVTLAVCGQFDREAILTFARSLGDGPAQPWLAPEPLWRNEKATTVTLAKRNQTHLLWTFPVPGQNHPDAPGLALLRAILAGQGGLLFRELRDGRGLGYSVTAMLWQTPGAGFVSFYAGVDPDKADEALTAFEAIARKLGREPLSEAEVARGKNLLRGEYFRERQSLMSRSQEAAGLRAKGMPPDHALKTVEAAEKLDPATLRDLAARLLDPAKATLLKVVP